MSQNLKWREFRHCSGTLGQFKNFGTGQCWKIFQKFNLGGNLFQFNSLENLSTIYNEIGYIYNRLDSHFF